MKPLTRRVLAWIILTPLLLVLAPLVIFVALLWLFAWAMNEVVDGNLPGNFP